MVTLFSSVVNDFQGEYEHYNNKRSLFTINLINCTIYLPKGRQLTNENILYKIARYIKNM